MQVHERPGVLLDLTRIHKHLRKVEAVLHVGRAAAPLPALLLIVESLFLLVASAAAQCSLGAGGRDGVRHAG